MTQKELESKIKAAQETYYSGNPTMSDAEFDTLWDTLKDLYPNSKLLTEVGSDLGESNGFKKVRHNIIMGSQSKANTAEEMDKFFKKGKTYIAQWKMDGSSVVLDYVNGKLVRAASRGNGEIGVDYTVNVEKMVGCVKELKSFNFTGSVRGEVLLKKSKLKEFPGMANCRNAATGVFHRIDGSDCEKLTVVVYDAQHLDKTKTFGTQKQLQEWLEDQGFIVAEWTCFENPTGKTALKFLKDVWADLDNIKFDIDGIVWKQDDIDMEDITSNYRPTTQIALKPARTVVKTTITDFAWELKGGTLTPVAILDPVYLLGATVKRASCANVSLLEDLDLQIGDEVEIARTGEIIPKVLRNLKNGKIAKGYENSFEE